MYTHLTEEKLLICSQTCIRISIFENNTVYLTAPHQLVEIKEK